MKLALGTVQFGLDYGISNAAGQVAQADAAHILALARTAGLDTLDTAVAYGNSEQVLGQIGVEAWRVVSKLPAIPQACVGVEAWVLEQTQASLARLGVNRLHGLLLHRPDQLLEKNGQACLAALKALKAQGLVQKIGVSVYGPEELERLFALEHFDMVQAPLNILDQRLVSSGWAARLKKAGVELHTRSAFLQGLLLSPAQQAGEKFSRWRPVWRAWADWLAQTGLTPLQACLAYTLSIDDVERVVVGVDSVKHLQEILDASSAKLPSLPDWPEPLDPMLINPARWNQL